MPKKKSVVRVKSVRRSWFRRHPLRTVGLLVLLGGLVYALFKPTIINLGDIAEQPSINILTSAQAEFRCGEQGGVWSDSQQRCYSGAIDSGTNSQGQTVTCARGERLTNRGDCVPAEDVDDLPANPRTPTGNEIFLCSERGGTMVNGSCVMPSAPPGYVVPTVCLSGQVLNASGVCVNVSDIASLAHRCGEQGGTWDNARRICLGPNLIRRVAPKVGPLRDLSGGWKLPLSCEDKYGVKGMREVNPSLNQRCNSDEISYNAGNLYGIQCTNPLDCINSGNNNPRPASCCAGQVAVNTANNEWCNQKTIVSYTTTDQTTGATLPTQRENLGGFECRNAANNRACNSNEGNFSDVLPVGVGATLVSAISPIEGCDVWENGRIFEGTCCQK